MADVADWKAGSGGFSKAAEALAEHGICAIAIGAFAECDAVGGGECTREV